VVVVLAGACQKLPQPERRRAAASNPAEKEKAPTEPDRKENVAALAAFLPSCMPAPWSLFLLARSATTGVLSNRQRSAPMRLLSRWLAGQDFKSTFVSSRCSESNAY